MYELFVRYRMRCLVVAAFSTLLAAVCAGVSGAATKASQLRIAGVAAVTSDPYFISMHRGAAAAAKALGGVSLSWQGPTSASVPQEIATLGTVAAGKPDGVILAPFSGTAFINPVQKLMKQGVPVYLADGPLNKNVAIHETFANVGSAGKVLATHIAALMGGKGELAIISSTPGDPVEGARYQSMVKIIKAKHPGITVLATQFANDDQNKSAQTVAGLLAAHPNLAGIFVTDGPAGQGAAAALKTAHKTGAVKLVAFDATPLEVRGLQDGSIQGLYAQAPYIDGYTAMTGLVKYLRGAGSSKRPVSPGKPYYIQAPLKFITKADLLKPDTKKYLYRATC
jgi:ribose transport system substrate-binding protein